MELFSNFFWKKIVSQINCRSKNTTEITLASHKPFGLRTLFRLRRPTNLRVRRLAGRGDLRRFRYWASTPSNTTPDVTETTISIWDGDIRTVQLKNLLSIVRVCVRACCDSSCERVIQSTCRTTSNVGIFAFRKSI